MILKDIPRTKPGVAVAVAELSEDALNSERAKLAQRASDLLGYRALQSDVRGQKLLGITSGPLTEALLKLDIEVLNSSHVIDYQIEEAGRHTRESIFENFYHYIAGYFSAASWSHTRLCDYQRPIPEFVLDKAVRIKEALPEVEFIVQHMTDAKADPFLVAKHINEIYYIEAWDEPRFEHQL